MRVLISKCCGFVLGNRSLFLHSLQIFIQFLFTRHGAGQPGQSSEKNIVPVLVEFIV